jgi:hypothetical protein
MDGPRLVLYTLTPEDVSDATRVSEFWEGILQKYLPETELEEPRLQPLQTCLRHAMNLGCLSVVFQNQVQDPDYAAEYHAYHGKLFSHVDRYCARMHVFSRTWDAGTDVLAALDEATDTDYLGFITLRPVTVSPVGATILRPPSGDKHFLLSKDRFEVHIAGRTFHVEGTPFMQQDNAVGACAQASIWMALRTLRKREGLAAHDPAQITSSATRFVVRGRTLPNRDGLEISQMMEAVRSAGYSATLLSFREPGRKPSRELLPRIRASVYPYIESEIPVILAMATTELGGHAVVLIGHGWGSEPLLCAPTILSEKKAWLYARNSVDWATPFYIHNDNSGPYLPIPDTAPKEEFSLDKVCYAIPLLPADVYMTAEEAEQAALRMIRHFGGEGFLRNDVHVVRTYLQERYRFREQVRTSDMVDALKRHYRLKSLPRRMWITEINLLEGYAEPLTGGARRIGEVIIDPTGEPTQAPFLSIHTPGILVDRDPDSGKIRLIPLQNDATYSPLIRR